MEQQIKIGDFVKVAGRNGAYRVYKIGNGMYQLLTSAGNLITAKQVVFFKSSNRGI